MQSTSTKSFSDLINTNKPVLVDFFTEWCGPCRVMAPILKELKTEVGDKIIILKVDVDKSPAAAQTYNVQGVPTLILFKNGKIQWRQAGVIPVNTLKLIVQQYQ
ncbi:MAG: thioredoxin [Bacteroidetes bacterium]|nr:thioredoxin [Bacteroidota bacterium]